MAKPWTIGVCASLWLLVCALVAGCGDDDAAGDDTAAGDAGEADAAADAGGQQDAGAQDAAADDAAEDAATSPPDPTMAYLDDGTVQGDVVGDAVRFLKIPYAKPPIGELRWAAPEAPEPWDGVRHESDFSAPCPQPPSQQTVASTEEDCLYLNVWRPNESVEGAPVMFWIHGGGFTTGSTGDLVPTTDDHLWYDGRFFAERHGIVVVTINYRLGVLGFFPNPALADEGSPVGNQGLLDQQHALRWVRDNIEQFGGDPGNVTIFGQSAGSGSVCMHMVSPGSRGLFHRAISQSGGCTGGRPPTDPDAVAQQLEDFASEYGCDADDLECLRDLDVTEFISTEAIDRTMGTEALRRAFNFGAGVDGEGGFLPEPAVDYFDRGEIAQVPYMLGSTTEESQLYFLSAPVPANEEEYMAELTERYGDFADRVAEMYPVSDFDGDYRRAMQRLVGDSGLVCGTHDTARRAVEAGLDVFMYNFNVTWAIADGVLGPTHASEISHVFGSPYEDTEENMAVADAMNAYWASFATDGDPNYDGAPQQWPAFMPDENDDDLRLQLDPEYEILESFRKEQCAMWREYYETL